MTKYIELSLPVPEGTKINSEYGQRQKGSGYHYGIDFNVLPKTEITSAAPGTVIRIIRNHKDFGNVIVIKHAEDQATLYAHLSSIKTGINDPVTESTLIGLSGSTGRSEGPHLHFEVIEGANNNSGDSLPN